MIRQPFAFVLANIFYYNSSFLCYLPSLASDVVGKGLAFSVLFLVKFYLNPQQGGTPALQGFIYSLKKIRRIQKLRRIFLILKTYFKNSSITGTTTFGLTSGRFITKRPAFSEVDSLKWSTLPSVYKSSLPSCKNCA